MERKLTAILSADVHGYSRLMRNDEEATFRTLTSHRKLIDALIEQHHGRFVNSAGDSVLAEFASVVNAVQCGTDIQATIEAANAKLPAHQQMEFRVGINLGDVIVDGLQIYGDGVNIAARLENLAQPGGICISDTVHAQIRNKLALKYQDLGPQKVKNIADPVRVFRVVTEAEGAAIHAKRTPSRKLLRRGGFSLAGLAIVIATFVLIQHVSLKPPHTSASIPPAQKPSLPLPDKPSIAVLPFTNMSGDHEQEYFSDGITDDLITDLSRLPGLFVIARDSTFTYKGKAAKLQDVSRELGVKYVVEGSVRKAADQVAITVQLADATTGRELWAERYNRPLKDVFTLQDDIVRRIVTTLKLQIGLSQKGVIIPRSTDNLEAYDDLLRGTQYFLTNTKDGTLKGRRLFEKAIALDPRYSAAYSQLGASYFLGWIQFDPDPNGLDRALQMVQRSIALDDSIVGAHGLLAAIYMHKGQNDLAQVEARRGIALDANSAECYFWLADVLNNEGRPTEGLAAAEKAIRLNPRLSANYVVEKGDADSQLGRWEEAIHALKTFLESYPDFIWAHAWLAMDYFNLGDRDAGQAETAQVERLIALTPNSASGYWALAFALNAQNEPVEGLAAANRGIHLDPQARGLLMIEAIAYQQLGRWDEALPVLKHYVALYPEDIFGHIQLAWDYSALGEMDAAGAEAVEVERCVIRDPNSSTYRGLAEVMNDIGKPAEALAAADKAKRLDPGRRDYLYEQGRAYAQLGRWDAAVAALKDYMTTYPYDVWSHVDLAADYIKVRQKDAARAEVTEILGVNPRFSVKMAVAGEFPAQRARAADLSQAGLK